MSLDLDDTIAAIASAPAGGLRGIVRISGPACVQIVGQVFRPHSGGQLSAGGKATCLDGCLALPRELGEMPARLYVWPDRRSYTRQPAAELHTLGSPPLLEAALETIYRAGARLARPGEFTLRAFLAGRLDLTQAEAVLGVIDAREATQLETALSQLAGGLAGPLCQLRESLLALLAHLEAGLDFAEEDIEFISAADLDRQLAAATEEVASLAGRMASRQETSQLPRVVLVGEPNAGKSSLFNALAGRAAAIVSEEAGTTRDFVSARIELADGSCLLIDTAGVSGAESPLTAAAQVAAGQQERQADVTLLCLDASRPATPWEELRLAGPHDRSELGVWTKTDLALPAHASGGAAPVAGTAICTSSRTGAGLDDLRRAIQAAVHRVPSEAGVVATTASRCRESLELATAALRRARTLAAERGGEELVAAELRAALDGLGQVVGAVYTEDVLDRVFSRFCIGK